MTSKEYLLAVLDRVSDDWDLAVGLQVLIQHSDLSPAVLDALVGIFSQVIKGLSDKQKEHKLTKALDVIQEIRNRELMEKSTDDKDLLSLDAMISKL